MKVEYNTILRKTFIPPSFYPIPVLIRARGAVLLDILTDTHQYCNWVLKNG